MKGKGERRHMLGKNEERREEKMSKGKERKLGELDGEGEERRERWRKEKRGARKRKDGGQVRA